MTTLKARIGVALAVLFYLVAPLVVFVLSLFGRNR